MSHTGPLTAKKWKKGVTLKLSKPTDLKKKNPKHKQSSLFFCRWQQTHCHIKIINSFAYAGCLTESSLFSPPGIRVKHHAGGYRERGESTPFRWLHVSPASWLQPLRKRLRVSTQMQHLQVHAGSCVSQPCQHKHPGAGRGQAGPSRYHAAVRGERLRASRTHLQPPTFSAHLWTYRWVASGGHHPDFRVLPPPTWCTHDRWVLKQTRRAYEGESMRTFKPLPKISPLSLHSHKRSALIRASLNSHMKQCTDGHSEMDFKKETFRSTLCLTWR